MTNDAGPDVIVSELGSGPSRQLVAAAMTWLAGIQRDRSVAGSAEPPVDGVNVTS
jgi:hypothetical protein